MKVLLLADSEEYLDDAVDIFSSSGISVVAKVTNGTAKEFSSMAEDALFKKGYNIVIGNIPDYIEAGIELNKNQGVRAAQINSKRDLKLSEKSKPNVMIFGSDMSLIKEFAIAMPAAHSAQMQQNSTRKTLNGLTGVPQKKPEQTRDINLDIQKSKLKKDIVPKKIEDDAREEEYNDIEEHRSRNGLFGRLKDSLGIIEDKEGD